MKKNTYLLITGCIAPNDEQHFLILKDKEERLRQYVASVLYYIKYSVFQNIIYCDNSNYNYEKLGYIYSEAKKYGKNFEWISFQGDCAKVLKCGKGYGEGEIIEYALKNSQLLCSSTCFFKVTGRLKVLNINSIVKLIKNQESNYFNRDIYAGRKSIDTRFYCVNTEFYKQYLLKVYEDCDIVSRSLENTFFNSLKRYKNLPLFPKVDGMSGGNGRNYATESRIKLSIFNLLCRLNVFNLIFPIYIAYRKVLLTIKGQC